MSAKSKQYIDGTCTIVGTHDAVQAAAGNATWLNRFFSCS